MQLPDPASPPPGFQAWRDAFMGRAWAGIMVQGPLQRVAALAGWASFAFLAYHSPSLRNLPALGLATALALSALLHTRCPRALRLLLAIPLVVPPAARLLIGLLAHPRGPENPLAVAWLLGQTWLILPNQTQFLSAAGQPIRLTLAWIRRLIAWELAHGRAERPWPETWPDPITFQDSHWRLLLFSEGLVASEALPPQAYQRPIVLLRDEADLVLHGHRIRLGVRKAGPFLEGGLDPAALARLQAWLEAGRG